MRSREKDHHIFGEGQVSGCGCNIKEMRGKKQKLKAVYARPGSLGHTVQQLVLRESLK